MDRACLRVSHRRAERSAASGCDTYSRGPVTVPVPTQPVVQSAALPIAAQQAASAPRVATPAPRAPTNVSRVRDYPVGRFEANVLDLINDPAATQVFLESWTIVQAARTSRPIEKKRLDEAFRKVAARHEALRARFARRSGGCDMIVEDSHRTGPVVTDLGPVSDTELKTVITAMAREPFDIENGPLFKLDVLRCGGRGDVLLLRAHHLVTDGWSQIMGRRRDDPRKPRIAVLCVRHRSPTETI